MHITHTVYWLHCMYLIDNAIQYFYRSGLGHHSISGLANPSVTLCSEKNDYPWYAIAKCVNQFRQKSRVHRKHCVFSFLSLGALFSWEEKMNYQKNTAELSANERLKLSLILTLTEKLLNHEIALWYFVLPQLRVHFWKKAVSESHDC